MSRYPQRERKPPLQDFQSIHHERAYVTGSPLPEEDEKKGFRNDALDKVWQYCTYIVLSQKDEVQIEKPQTATRIFNNSKEDVWLMLGVRECGKQLWVFTDTLRMFNTGHIPVMDLFFSTLKAKHPSYFTDWTANGYSATPDWHEMVSVTGLGKLTGLMPEHEDIELIEKIVENLELLEKELHPPKLGTRQNPILLTRP